MTKFLEVTWALRNGGLSPSAAWDGKAEWGPGDKAKQGPWLRADTRQTCDFFDKYAADFGIAVRQRFYMCQPHKVDKILQGCSYL